VLCVGCMTIQGYSDDGLLDWLALYGCYVGEAKVGLLGTRFLSSKKGACRIVFSKRSGLLTMESWTVVRQGVWRLQPL